ncbi:MAG TPA: LysR family transcriptional regulator [Alphaproteobacteria bacterium]|jgi:DNA-binding transcriptional LysR family regulator|nr:LysR family transcriptional regulator [Alphaproteobacteria bacterium]
MKNLNDIAIFARVVEKKSFSTAARELGLSTSLVSKRIRALEEELKTQLLKRSTHFLSLTEAGATFYERCSSALELLDGAGDEIDRSGGLRGTVRIFAALGFGEHVLWKIASEFSAQYPEVSVRLEIGDRSTNVLEKGVDVAIRSANLPDTSLEYRELGALRYHICAAPRYLEREGVPESPEDLRRYNCLIHTAHKPADRWRFAGPQGSLTVRVAGNFLSNSGIAIHGACVDGLGIARLPEYVVRDAVKSGRLQILFPGRLRFERNLKAFYSRTRHLPLKVSKLLDFLESRLAGKLH